MNSIFKTIALAAAALACVAAQAGGAYVGGTIGTTRAHTDLPTGYTSQDKSDNGFRLYGGLKLTDRLSAEVGYFDLGKTTQRRNAVVDQQSTSAWTFGLAWRQPVYEQFFVVGRVGLASLHGKLESTTTANNSESDKIRAYLGLGLGYAITPQIDLQGSWDFMRTGLEGQGTRRVDLFGVGVTYSF
jgi:hypothetical protein